MFRPRNALTWFNLTLTFLMIMWAAAVIVFGVRVIWDGWLVFGLLVFRLVITFIALLSDQFPE